MAADACFDCAHSQGPASKSPLPPQAHSPRGPTLTLSFLPSIASIVTAITTAMPRERKPSAKVREMQALEEEHGATFDSLLQEDMIKQALAMDQQNEAGNDENDGRADGIFRNRGVFYRKIVFLGFYRKMVDFWDFCPNMAIYATITVCAYILPWLPCEPRFFSAISLARTHAHP